MKSFQIYTSVERLPKTWNTLVAHDVFLQTSYLKGLEEASPNNIQIFYIGIFNDDILIGGAIIQRVQLYLKDMFRTIQVSCVKEFFRDVLSKILKGNILVIGNLTHTGQHGLFFQKKNIAQANYLDLVFEALEGVKNNIRATQNKTIRAIMLKDYFEDDTMHLEHRFLDDKKLHKVTVQPNMIMSINPEWISINDYFSALNKKYKARYKRARIKLGAIKSVELELETIELNSKRLHKLYLNVSNNAKFNTFLLIENHFYSLKKHLKDNFKVFGYYLNNELVGFYTLLLNNENLETYFLGYDSEHQHNNQLYLNMLYDMAKYGIENGFSNIVYARTAMEIKSSVGAKPKPMVIYLKHTNGLINGLLKQVFRFMNPTQDWEERHPYQ